jgi:hypothetical protein
MEADYSNGIRDEEGNLLMRPLDKEEKDFLAKFYKEEVHNKLDITEEIKKEKKILQNLKFTHRGYRIKNKVKHPEVLAQETKIEEMLKLQGNWNYTTEDQKRLNKDNNDRNSCIYNRAKASNTLHSSVFDVNMESYVISDGLDSQLEKLQDVILEESFNNSTDKPEESS